MEKFPTVAINNRTLNDAEIFGSFTWMILFQYHRKELLYGALQTLSSKMKQLADTFLKSQT